MNFDFRDTRNREASFSTRATNPSYFSSFPQDWIVKTWKNENLFHLRPPSGDEKFRMTAFMNSRLWIHIDEYVAERCIFSYFSRYRVHKKLLQSDDSPIWNVYSNIIFKIFYRSSIVSFSPGVTHKTREQFYDARP